MTDTATTTTLLSAGSMDATDTLSRRRLDRTRRWGTRILAAIGALAVVGTGAGVVRDVLDFDNTTGGYEAPYTGWTGTPIDWAAGGITRTGFHKPGSVVDVDLDCTTGMVTFTAFGLSYDWRQVSDRAIAVHRPREACTAAGFTPRF